MSKRLGMLRGISQADTLVAVQEVHGDDAAVREALQRVATTHLPFVSHSGVQRSGGVLTLAPKVDSVEVSPEVLVPGR
eukprot:8728962-Pyramimonas_sp.AAC.1